MLVGLMRSLTIAFGAFALGLVIGVAGALGKLGGGGATLQALDLCTANVRSVPGLVLILNGYFAGADLNNGGLTAGHPGKDDLKWAGAQ